MAQNPPTAARVGERLASSRKMIAQRLIIAAPLTIVAGIWTGPLFVAAWYAAVVVFEVWAAPAARRLFVGPARERPHARAAMTAIKFAGNILYIAPITAGWFIGGASFAYIAAIYLSISLLHAMTFGAGDRWELIASAAPAVVNALIMTIVTTSAWIAAAAMLFAIAQLLFVIHLCIRDRKVLIDQTVKYRTDAVDAERANIAKSQFLATMSHELRTPLNAVIGYAEIIEEDLAAGVLAKRDDARRISAAARTLLALINDVLDLSKVEAGKMKIEIASTRVADVINTVRETCQHIAEANGNRIVVALDPTIEIVATDAARLRQCVLNLASNACKFTKNGEVRITTARRQTPHGPHLVIRVSDTGIGIAPEQLARLFQPFVQVDSSETRAYGGTGLGLAITKRLVDLLGGDVTLSSEIGKGTTGVISVPAAAPNAAAREAA